MWAVILIIVVPIIGTAIALACIEFIPGFADIPANNH
jgi:hypothetical protein